MTVKSDPKEIVAPKDAGLSDMSHPVCESGYDSPEDERDYEIEKSRERSEREDRISQERSERP